MIFYAVNYVRESLCLENTQPGMSSFNSVTQYGKGSVMVWAAMLWYSVGSIISLHRRITAREYVDRFGNHVHPMI
jgi:hypothetical protein